MPTQLPQKAANPYFTFVESVLWLAFFFFLKLSLILIF